MLQDDLLSSDNMTEMKALNATDKFYHQVRTRRMFSLDVLSHYGISEVILRDRNLS